MAFVSEMVDQLRDLLNDPTDTQVTFATKKLYLNRGIQRLWPSIYRVVSTTIPLVLNVYDYSLAAAVMDGLILSVEVSTVPSGAEFERFNAYDVIPGDEDLAGVLRITRHPGDAYIIRIKYVAALPTISAASYAAAQSETWLGPDRAIGLPPLYAMGHLVARKLDDRQDTDRYSTTQALNGVTDQDLMAGSQMWFAQFELELESQSRPLPPARD